MVKSSGVRFFEDYRRAAEADITGEMRADVKNATSPFKAMAQKYDVSVAQLWLRWGIQNAYAVLPKSSNPDRMRQNIGLSSFAIDDGNMALVKTMNRGDGVAWASGDTSLVKLHRRPRRRNMDTLTDLNAWLNLEGRKLGDGAAVASLLPDDFSPMDKLCLKGVAKPQEIFALRG